MLLQKKSNNEFNLFEINFQNNVEASTVLFEKDYKMIYKKKFFLFLISYNFFI